MLYIMITQKGFTCYILKAKKIEKENNTYYLCQIGLPVQYKGFWKRKNGERYYEKWNNVNIYTDMPLEIEDKLKVTKFMIKKYMKPASGFREKQYLTLIYIYAFKNETQGYKVEKEKRKYTKKAKTKTENIEKIEEPKTIEPVKVEEKQEQTKKQSSGIVWGA